jgi:hypothetical protein
VIVLGRLPHSWDQSGLDVFESMTFWAKHRPIRRGSECAVVLDIKRLGLALNDPNGHLRLDEKKRGQEDAVIRRMGLTEYTGAKRDDANFTFVLQRDGRSDIQTGGRDYGMAPGSLVAFRPNERRTQVRAGRRGLRTAATLQLPFTRMHKVAQDMETSVEAAFPQGGFALSGDGALALGRVLLQLADDLFLRPFLPLPPRMAQGIKHLIDDVLCEMNGRTVERPSVRRIFPAFRRVRQADDVMPVQSDEPISILDSAKALDVSMRSLQLAFAEVHGGQTPREVLRHPAGKGARAPFGSGQGAGDECCDGQRFLPLGALFPSLCPHLWRKTQRNAFAPPRLSRG